MILFKVIRWKNLLSTGNAFTEIKLNETANALIIGENGAGKSTILDALTFALFGKAFRKVNKPGLVNSVNEKNCEVQIEFATNGKEYKVIRGIKPNVFEIYCDGILLNQDSASKDYQEHLEKFILKMNYKSFTQIVILGSASFTPFMQLSPADRRTVIEDLLDIQIFSLMNTITKQRLLANKDMLERNRIELAGKEEKRVFIEKTLSSLKTNNEEKKKHLQSTIEIHRSTYDRLRSDIERLEEEREQLVSQATDQVKSKDRHRKLVGLQAKIEANLGKFQKEHRFFCDNDTCPTCSQSLELDFKTERIKETETEITKLEKGLTDIGVQIDEAINTINTVDALLRKADTLKNDISVKRNEQMHLSSVINDLEDQIEGIDNADKIVIDNQNELDETIGVIQHLTTEREQLLNDRKYIDTALNLLKDGGIKTKIIKQYLPIINKQINKYLAQMGFFVNFNIDENFEESIKSRYRDEFSYHNFSEGEKMRIDLALLFTWRSIAKMRNSVNTNLLILDEVFDGSLDGNGTDEFLKIMWSMIGDTNTFVISHKTDQLFDKFQKVYRFGKIKNFSVLTS
jgi:DNA repair exonuclease SbcCD ATPase subunit